MLSSIIRSPIYRGLFSDMAQHPDDDSIRLIIADFIEESGCDDWAESIRYQISHPCKFWQCDADESVGLFCSWKSPCENCLAMASHGVPWEVLCNDSYRIRRGFLESIVLNANDFVAFRRDVLAASPVQYIFIPEKEPYRSINKPTFYAWVRSANYVAHRESGFFVSLECFEKLGGVGDTIDDPKLKRYPTRKDAIDDLARSIVVCERELLARRGYLL